MSAGYKIHEFLKTKGVSFEVLMHPKRWTAVETAAVEDVPLSIFAKVVIVKVNGEDAMFVIPADSRIDLLKVSYQLGTQDLRVEEENEFQDIFTDAEKGAMPPFGALYGIPVYLDIAFEDKDEIVFNAGSHTESIKMRMKDYLVLAEAEFGDYSVPKHLRQTEGGEPDEARCG